MNRSRLLYTVLCTLVGCAPTTPAAPISHANENALMNKAVHDCGETGSPADCLVAAEMLWSDGQLQPALAALTAACASGGDTEVCDESYYRLEVTHIPKDIEAVVASTLPCGHFSNPSSIVGDLDFGDYGVVTVSGKRYRARLEDGLVKVDRAVGDWQFITTSDGNLIGFDSWNRYGYLRRSAESKSECLPPRAYRSAPADDGSLPPRTTWRQACERGDPYACQAEAAWVARHEGPLHAEQLYIGACKANLRDGCEALAWLERLKACPPLLTAGACIAPSYAVLSSICTADARSPACDVLEVAD